MLAVALMAVAAALFAFVAVFLTKKVINPINVIISNLTVLFYFNPKMEYSDVDRMQNQAKTMMT